MNAAHAPITTTFVAVVLAFTLLPCGSCGGERLPAASARPEGTRWFCAKGSFTACGRSSVACSAENGRIGSRVVDPGEPPRDGQCEEQDTAVCFTYFSPTKGKQMYDCLGSEARPLPALPAFEPDAKDGAMRVLLCLVLATSSMSFSCKTDDSKKTSPADKTDDKDDKSAKDKKKKSDGDDDGDDKCRTTFAAASKNKGNELKFTCPADCDLGASIYGTGWYTADSPICVAAVHAGAIKVAKGGEVTLKAHKGLKAYLGTKANAVKSAEWGPFGDSYSINGSDDANGTPKKGENLKLTCTDNVASVGSDAGDDFKGTCPPGCIDKGGSVWGTGKYTSDSSICKAAVHAAVITDDDGGDVHVKVVDGEDKYTGTKKNGVKTEDFGPYAKSFTVE